AREQARQAGAPSHAPDPWQRAEDARAAAGEAFAGGAFDRAEARWRESADAYADARTRAAPVAAAREEAVDARTSAEDAIRRAREVDAPRDAPDAWGRAETLFGSAVDAFAAGSFDEAADLWGEAERAYTRAREAANVGGIRITATSVPGDTFLANAAAEIALDGGAARPARLPHVVEGLAVGAHRVELRVPNYTASGPDSVIVRDGETVPVAFRLTPKPARVTITTHAPGAEVYDGRGRRLASAGEPFDVAPFVDHRLVVRAPGRRTAEVNVAADTPGEALGERHVTLDEAPGPVVETTWPFSAADAKRRQALTAERMGLPEEVTVDLGAGATMDFVLIPPGEFMMGSADDAAGRRDNEGPIRRVTISRPYYMAMTEVTQAQWRAVTGTTVGRQRDRHDRARALRGEGPTCPMVFVSWNEAAAFCRTLSEKTGREVRLPTEAQWEFACRAGTSSRYGFGDAAGRLEDYGWFRANSAGQARPVARKRPNAFGLYDMHGNVWELCSDWSESYDVAGHVDPEGPPAGTYRVGRGGSWRGDATYCRSAARGGFSEDFAFDYLGFRPVLVVTPDDAAARSVETAPAPTTGIRGRVTAVDTDQQVAQLNVGAADGVRAGMRFILYRGPDYVGGLVVVRVDSNTSVGVLRQTRLDPRPGDNAATKLEDD
ncbi:MAG: SUMF1/EgtB/PvdO family nonheme iron enzyme, partial [Planctomycetota bacterium]